MKVIEFEAVKPASDSELEKLQLTLKLFDTIRKKVMNLDKSPVLTREAQEDIATEFGSDRFMVEDIIGVLLDQTSPIFPEYRASGFWTFGRQTPRFGTPWGTLVFDDTRKTIELMVRYGGSFEDDEDPPLWLTCQILSTEGASYDELDTLSKQCKVLDIWWHLRDSNLAGKLVFR
jgi:hypothetical protein